MFFIGATGQLLTLLLTVILPFIFVFPGFSGNTSRHEATTHIAQLKQTEIPVSGVDAFHPSIQTAPENQNKIFEIESNFSLDRAHNPFLKKWKSIFINSSGNKAPPKYFSF